MEQPLTTYTVKGKNFPLIMEFSFSLDGLLKNFTIIDGVMSEKFQNWIFHPARFPYKETLINSWKGISNIEVIVGTPDLSFNTFYKMYSNKVGKLEAERAWKKLSKVDQLKAIKQINAYDGFLKRKHTAKAYPATYLNKRRFEDEFGSIH